MDVLAVRAASEEAVARARSGGGPSFVEAVTYRFVKHSTWSKESRPLEEIEEWKLRCPIASFAKRCGLDAADLRAEVDEIVATAARFAEESPFPSPEDALVDVGGS
jgi:pyruvate dehydrogenase E1 component alpha subunit